MEKKSSKVIDNKTQKRVSIPQSFVKELSITDKDEVEWTLNNKKLKGELIKN